MDSSPPREGYSLLPEALSFTYKALLHNAKTVTPKDLPMHTICYCCAQCVNFWESLFGRKLDFVFTEHPWKLQHIFSNYVFFPKFLI